jgi:hypothetical protein
LTTDRIYFSTLAEFMQETSTNRETVDMFAFMSRTGTLSSVAVWADAFVGANGRSCSRPSWWMRRRGSR